MHGRFGLENVRVRHPRVTFQQETTATPVTVADQGATLNWTLPLKESELRRRHTARWRLPMSAL